MEESKGYYLVLPENRDEVLEILNLLKPFLNILKLKK